MERFSAFFVTLVDHAGLAGLFVAMIAGNIGAPVGSEVLIPVAGALVATGHLPTLWSVIAAAIAGELVGAGIGYAIGRYGGRPFVHRYGPYVRFHEADMARVDAFFTKHGSFAVFLCRFIPVVRGIVSIPAGIARMPLVPFYLWYLLGSLGFCGVLAYLGFVLGNHLDRIIPWLREFSLLAVVVLVLAVAYGVFRLFSHRPQRETR